MTDDQKRGFKVTWQLLNAYVDEELDAATRADVAATAAADASTAARIATLSRLKAQLGKPERAPGEPPPFEARRRLPVPALALAGALALLVVAIAAVSHRGWMQPRQPEWLVTALAAHREWTRSEALSRAGPNSRLSIAVSRNNQLFDLSDAELVPLYVATLAPQKSAHGTFVGYRGPHGCLVGLWMGVPSESLTFAPKAFDADGVLVRAWGNSTGIFALLSRGMDPHRIDRLAAVVAHISGPGHHLGEDTRVALQQVPHTGRACRT